VKRREFVAGLGAAAWPLAARAQRPAMPVIGYLSNGSPELFTDRLRAFRQSLSETGFVEGSNVAIDYGWAGDELDRLPTLAADLARRQVNVISAFGGINGALAAKSATTTIPIVFGTGDDPIAAGLVASLNRPGGNITGVVTLGVEVAPKRLELMYELLPTAAMAVLINPARPTADAMLRDLQTAARTLGQSIHVLRASTGREIDAAFATLVELRAGALVIANDAYFNARTQQLAH
jgi:putative tryptophan/tyrosine transport system substrate-binding protein